MVPAVTMTCQDSHQGQQGEKQHLRKTAGAGKANAMGESHQKFFLSQGRSTVLFILPPMAAIAASYCSSLIPTKIPLMEEEEDEKERGRERL